MAAPRPDGGPNDGWNDPPLFTYNPSVQTAAPQRTHLNKRVSFPLSSGGSPAEQTLAPKDASAAGVLLSPKDGPPKLPPVQILPPTSSTSVHPPVPLLLPSISPPIDPSGLPPSFLSAVRDPQRSETLPELLERLELDSADSLRKYTKKILHEMVDVCKENIQGRSREDVQARLGILDDQWRDDKLSEGAKTKLGCLASALKHNDLKQADSLHLALMVDHISEVSQWMVGVKRLINELKLLKSPPQSSSPKKILNPASAAIVSTIAAEQGEAVTNEDVCVDTDQFSNLKPVLMPEDLVKDLAPAELQAQQNAQQLSPTVNEQQADKPQKDEQATEKGATEEEKSGNPENENR